MYETKKRSDPILQWPILLRLQLLHRLRPLRPFTLSPTSSPSSPHFPTAKQNGGEEDPPISSFSLSSAALDHHTLLLSPFPSAPFLSQPESFSETSEPDFDPSSLSIPLHHLDALSSNQTPSQLFHLHLHLRLANRPGFQPEKILLLPSPSLAPPLSTATSTPSAAAQSPKPASTKSPTATAPSPSATSPPKPSPFAAPKSPKSPSAAATTTKASSSAPPVRLAEGPAKLESIELVSQSWFLDELESHDRSSQQLNSLL
ncbi:hypothetical protein ACLB2K_055266 [Fragaria x ananassa]